MAKNSLLKIPLFVICGVIISLFLFYGMQRMLVFEAQDFSAQPSTFQLDFITLLPLPPPTKKPITALPKAPPLKKPTPLPPKPTIGSIAKIKAPPLQYPKFQVELPLSTTDALYLGKFSPAITATTDQQSNEEVIPLLRIAPKYPARAARRGIEGWVRMQVNIDASGAVTQAKVIAAQPKRIFNKAALRAMKKWRFRPRIVAGKPVKRTAMQEIRFELK